MPDLGIFRLQILKKKYCHIWNQQPLICYEGVFNQYIEFQHRDRLF